MTFVSKLDNAISQGLNYIQLKKSEDGLWRDFRTLAGQSSDWVSGFVAYAVYCNQELDDRVMKTFKILVERQRSNGGWSYNSEVPTDCDSTAWVVLCLSLGPVWKPSAIRRALHYIQMHQTTDDGGFATYTIHDGIHDYIKAPHKKVIRGWTHSHASVTSVAIQSLLINGISVQSETIQKAAKFLLSKREKSGIWSSYWWKGYSYSTYHALKTLCMCRAILPSQKEETISFLLSQQREDGGWNDAFGLNSEVFATAFVSLSLMLNPYHETLSAVHRGMSWLVKKQNIDGSWSTQPILRIPPSDITNPDFIQDWPRNRLGTGVIVADEERLFTSAAALWALTLFRSMAY